MERIPDTRYVHRPWDPERKTWEWMSLREQIVDQRMEDLFLSEPPERMTDPFPPRFWGIDRGAFTVEDCMQVAREYPDQRYNFSGGPAGYGGGSNHNSQRMGN